MNKAIFWDRDGVLVELLAVRYDGLKNVGPGKFEEFKVAKGTAEALKQTKAKDYINIMATNQPDISRNKLSWAELNRMHDFLKGHAPSLDAVYVCPHSDEDNCHCRKPKPGLLLDAAKEHQLDLSLCYMVGDAQKDIDAANAAGVKSVLLTTDYNKDVKNQNLEIKSLEEILNFI